MSRTEARIPKLEIKLLGRFEVLRDGVPISEDAWGRQKTKKLLKALLTDPGHVFTQDQLIDVLFEGEDIDKATKNLYGRISQLRRALEPDLKRGAESSFIRREGQGYSFNVCAFAEIDTLAFQKGVRDAQSLCEAGDWARATERFEEAIAVYRGDFLPEDRYEVWAEESSRHLRGQHLEALLSLARCYARLGRTRQAISHCQRLLAIEPHREDAARELMEYQDQAGQRAEAIETYEEFRRVLRAYLDVEPSAETQAVYRAIRDRQISTHESRDPRRIAVLPLANLSPDPGDEYYADGMTEVLIGRLSRIGDLRVVARTSVMRYKNTSKPISKISRELNAGTLLEGSVQNLGDEFRVSIQLIDGLSEDHLWAEEYDCTHGDFLQMQPDIAEQVARSLEIQLLPDEEERVSSLPTESIEAHLLYMRGLHEVASDSDVRIEKGISLYEEAIAIDPACAPAYAGIAHAMMLLSRSTTSLDVVRPDVQASLDRAFELDPQLPEAHNEHGLFLWAFERDSVGAEAAIRRAIQISPSYVDAHAMMRDLLGQCGRHGEELAEAREALALSAGLDLEMYYGVGQALIHLGRLAEAIVLFEEGRSVDPNRQIILRGLAHARERLWEWDTAEEHRRRLLELSPESPWTNMGYVTHHLHSRGRISESLKLIHSFPRHQSDDVLIAYLEGRSLVLARRYREAIEIFSRAAEAHELGLAHTGWYTINLERAIAHRGVDEVSKAVEYFERAYEEALSFGAQWFIPVCEAGIAWARRLAGNENAIPKLVKRLLGQSDRPSIPTLLAVLYFSAENLNEGFKWLDVAVDRHDPWPLPLIKTHPWFDPARDDPRFTDVLKKMNLAD